MKVPQCNDLNHLVQHDELKLEIHEFLVRLKTKLKYKKKII